MLTLLDCERDNALYRAISALKALDPGVDRANWIRITAAAKDAGVSFEDWHEWCAQAGNYAGDRDCQAAWRSIRPGGGITSATLFHLARNVGWRDEGARGRPPNLVPQPPAASRVANRHRPLLNPGELLDWQFATSDHRYIARKEIVADGLKVAPAGLPRIAGYDVEGWLAIPAWSLESDTIQSIQFTSDDPLGRKLNLPGTSFTSCYFAIHRTVLDGKLSDAAVANNRLYLAEGLATASTINRATSACTLVTFGKGNMRQVARVLRQRYPDTDICLCPDRGGEDDARRICAEISAQIIEMPEYCRPNSDLNDLEVENETGPELVRSLLASPVELDGCGSAKSQLTPILKAPDLDVADVRDGTQTTRPLTEFGNAMRLIDHYGERLRYVPETTRWLVWGDCAWAWDNDGAAVRAEAAALHSAIYEEGKVFKAGDGVHFARWARTSQTERVIRGATKILSDQQAIRLPLATVDADAMLVGLASATQIVDLKIGRARAARPEDYVTKTLKVNSVGDSSKAARWHEFLGQVFENDQELIDWLWRWCGYLLSGSTVEQFLIFCYGAGANGKSIFAETLRYILGDYGRAVQVETFCESRRAAGGASPDLADLIGTRFVMSSETEDGQALAESLVKSLVSGDSMSARPLYGKPVQFQPQFKLMMLGNHKPNLRGNDDGIWRRFRLVPFNTTFGPDRRDPHLLEKLKAEAPHILAWMIEGCLEWQRRGLGDVPRVVKQQTAEYREEQDLFGNWLTECCVRSAALETSKKKLQMSYQSWARQNGLLPISPVSLGRKLSERGFRSRRSNGDTIWRGVGLKPGALLGGISEAEPAKCAS